MDSDEDLFYDSLDEEFFNCTIAYDQDSVPSGTSTVVEKTVEADSVPLYGGEISRNDLSIVEANKNKCKKCFLRNPLIKRNSRSDYFVLEKDDFTSRGKNSYLSLFTSRTKGKSDRIPGLETDRATDGDVTETFSFCSGFTGSTEHYCEFKDCVNDQSYDDCIYCESARANGASEISLDTGVSEMSGLKSVSYQQLTESTKSERLGGRKLCGKPKTQIVSPVLGSLGPNIDQRKLELLRRKQNYGLKASQKNRIKFMEKQLLQNLKKEIENCRENRKKELDDNKKEPETPSVL